MSTCEDCSAYPEYQLQGKNASDLGEENAEDSLPWGNSICPRLSTKIKVGAIKLAAQGMSTSSL